MHRPSRVHMLSPTATLLERYMDLLSARQRVTAANIANADTPGYRARDIDFRAEMERLLAAGTSAAPAVPALLTEEPFGAGAKNDGNNVNLDHEMGVLADNTLRFTIASLLLQREIHGLQSVIREGRGA